MTTAATISSILIEALARRAHTVALNAAGGIVPTVERFVAEFNAELARFDSADYSRNVASPVTGVRAKLVPDSDRPSLGRGLGQQSGGTAQSDAEEARRILAMIANVDAEVIAEVCGGKAGAFVEKMQVRRSNGGPVCVTGKQLFWLREIRDQLVERGYV